jgi:hypothetical protein
MIRHLLQIIRTKTALPQSAGSNLSTPAENHSNKNGTYSICGIIPFDTSNHSSIQKSAQICALIRDNLRETLLPAAICVKPFSFPTPQPTSLP